MRKPNQAENLATGEEFAVTLVALLRINHRMAQGLRKGIAYHSGSDSDELGSTSNEIQIQFPNGLVHDLNSIDGRTKLF